MLDFSWAGGPPNNVNLTPTIDEENEIELFPPAEDKPEDTTSRKTHRKANETEIIQMKLEVDQRISRVHGK